MKRTERQYEARWNPSRPLTTRQAEVLQFIEDYLVAEQTMPSIRDIGEAFGISSPNGVICHLRALEKRDLIERDTNKARGIRLKGVTITIERTEAA